MHGLERILRVRSLLENLAHLEWEKKAAEARHLELIAAAHGLRARAVRDDALARLQKQDRDGTASWLLGLADADLHTWQRTRLTQKAAQRQPAIQTAHAEFLVRRRDRRQVEILLMNAAKVAAKERGRREQKQMDDWYQSRAGRARRAPK